MIHMTRRQMIGGVVAGAAMSAVGGRARASEVNMLNNKDFYKADGGFDAAAAKEAYYDMMRRFNYPIVDRLKGEEFWAVDFGLGKFTEVGMAGIFWLNVKEHDFFGHEIYLLPGQMIPEHRHLKTEEARPKMEGWHTRHGFVWTYGEGEPNPGDVERVPPSPEVVAQQLKLVERARQQVALAREGLPAVRDPDVACEQVRDGVCDAVGSGGEGPSYRPNQERNHCYDAYHTPHATPHPPAG